MIVLVLNEVFAFILGVSFNILLLYLIQRRTPSLMSSYAQILRVHAASDIIFELVNFFTSTYCTTMHGRFYFYAGFPTSLNQYATSISVRAYLWIVVYVPLVIVPLDFLYRLRAVTKGVVLSKRSIALYIFLAYSVSFLFAFPYNGAYMRAPLEMFILSLIVLVVWVDYSFIIFVVVKIRRKMSETVQAAVSKKAEATQRTVTRVMIVQAMVPLILCLPTSINVGSGLLLIDMPNFAPFVFGLISWTAALKPLCTILLVPHYRASVLRLSYLSSNTQVNGQLSYSKRITSSPAEKSSQRPEAAVDSPKADVAFFPNY
ncbi:hypothetical protein M3Y99_00758200 [Aphelenchoides fujianensis]|nr:hypothetical protein M3Y99_00758200 [Aphelenchoides fujianensis]